jgi:hypothetical protein
MAKEESPGAGPDQLVLHVIMALLEPKNCMTVTAPG